MKKHMRILLVIGCAILCLEGLREFGVLDVNLYKSALSASQSATIAQSYTGEESHFSYHLTVNYRNAPLYADMHSYNNDVSPIEIAATFDEPVYSGNSLLPLAKDFKMTYQCKFTSAKSPGGRNVHGQIGGEVKAQIYGLCSRRKARELAFSEARQEIISYFQKQL